MISLNSSIHFKSNRVFIFSENAQQLVESLSAEEQNFVTETKAGKSDFEYIKTAAGFFIVVRQKEELEKMRIAGNKVRNLLPKECKTIAINSNDAFGQALAEGISLSNYQFIHYFKDAAEKQFLLESIVLCGEGNEIEIEHLNNIIKATCWTRTMVNEPVSFLTAVQLSKEIEKLGVEAGFSVTVLEKNKIEALKMGGILAVNRGSQDPPTFTIIEHKPPHPKNDKPLVLVGKGVVYDTGGLSLKPTKSSMDLMKSDMAGAAAVAGAVYAAALNKSDTHVIGLIPATDNRPGENAYTPGDVITMFDGTTVEVLNTDAEGRMILADALAYSNKLNPSLVIDLATLTGAAVAAIGVRAAICMGNASDETFENLEKAGNSVAERVVRFPFWDEYYEDVKSSIADLKNIGGPYAGMITAGKFLEHFVKSPYIHIDIAGPAFLEAGIDYKGKGGTGYGVRLLTAFINQQ
jgi:leucyl aminopeptidase